MLDFNAIYILWLREVKRYVRSKARIIGAVLTPVVFMLGLGFGLNSLVRLPGGVSYLDFIVPGIVGMTLLFTGSYSGFMVIWDRQFGFLKEIMVTPNSRVSIALGRIFGGATTAIIPALLVLVVGLFAGFRPVISPALLLTLVFIILIGIVFISIGLIFASFVDDPQAFGLIVNFITFPLLFLSGAIFPVNTLPFDVKYVTYFNPLSYGVDGLRYALLGSSTLSPLADVVGLLVAAVIMVALSAIALRKAAVD